MLILIDGSNLAHRSVHSSFKELGYYSAMESLPFFFKRLVQILEFHNLKAGVIVAWDKGLPVHRRELYSEYKPDSSPIGIADLRLFSKINTDSSLDHHRINKSNKEMISTYTKLVDLLSSVILPLSNCISSRVLNAEADDIIAYCCYKLPEVEKQIVSTDKDFLQLITETTSVNNYSEYKNYDWIQTNYNNPEMFRTAFLLEKAIVGDTADNINGIEAVGEVTAKKITKELIKSIKSGLSLKDSIELLEKPAGTTTKGFTALKSNYELIQRNLDLMDLFLPINRKLPMVYDIHKNLMGYLNFNITYEQSMDKLEKINELPFNTCYSLIDKIFESNCNFGIRKILEEIRDYSN